MLNLRNRKKSSRFLKISKMSLMEKKFLAQKKLKNNQTLNSNNTVMMTKRIKKVKNCNLQTFLWMNPIDRLKKNKRNLQNYLKNTMKVVQISKMKTKNKKNKNKIMKNLMISLMNRKKMIWKIKLKFTKTASQILLKK